MGYRHAADDIQTFFRRFEQVELRPRAQTNIAYCSESLCTLHTPLSVSLCTALSMHTMLAVSSQRDISYVKIKNIWQTLFFEDFRTFRAAQQDCSNIIAASSISPPLNARARYVRKAMTVEKYNKEVIDSIGWRWDSPRWVSTAAVTEGMTNLPVNWFAKQAELVKLTFVDVNEATRGEKALINLGWNPYAIGVEDEEFKQIKIKARADKKERKAAERKSKAETDKQLEKQRLLKRTPKEIETDKAKAAKKQKETTRKSKETRKANKKASDIARWKKARGMDYISEDIQD